MNFILILLNLSTPSSFAAKEPPKVFVDKGACPFECCTYREWTVLEDTKIFDAIDGKVLLETVKKGAKVTGLTGEVHTTPLQIKDKDGKAIYLLTYLGEGFWKTWVDGAVKENGEVNSNNLVTPQSTWWVKIKLQNGKIGWTKETNHFGNKDSCA